MILAQHPHRNMLSGLLGLGDDSILMPGVSNPLTSSVLMPSTVAHPNAVAPAPAVVHPLTALLTGGGGSSSAVLQPGQAVPVVPSVATGIRPAPAPTLPGQSVVPPVFVAPPVLPSSPVATPTGFIANALVTPALAAQAASSDSVLMSTPTRTAPPTPGTPVQAGVMPSAPATNTDANTSTQSMPTTKTYAGGPCQDQTAGIPLIGGIPVCPPSGYTMTPAQVAAVQQAQKQAAAVGVTDTGGAFTGTQQTILVPGGPPPVASPVTAPAQQTPGTPVNNALLPFGGSGYSYSPQTGVTYNPPGSGSSSSDGSGGGTSTGSSGNAITDNTDTSDTMASAGPLGLSDTDWLLIGGGVLVLILMMQGGKR
jgi:hypothetical protein